ncbi:DUF1565 domain-containing protein, partial [bacterium]|nr:DUF1565 domain-containing protein [bacterium]
MRKSQLLTVFVALFLTLGLVSLGGAADYYVNGASGDDASDGSEGSPWQTITHALLSVEDTGVTPATIFVAAGTYAASTNGETFPLNMQSWVSLSGEDAETTILDAESDSNHVIYASEVDELTIEGFTITGGYASIGNGLDLDGGGICLSQSSPTISGNIIT